MSQVGLSSVAYIGRVGRPCFRGERSPRVDRFLRIEEELVQSERTLQAKNYLERIQNAMIYPWTEPQGKNKTILGHSIAAHHNRMLDIISEIDKTGTRLNKKLILQYALVDGDCPFLNIELTEEDELNRIQKMYSERNLRESRAAIKKKYSALRVERDMPYPYLIEWSPKREYAIAKCVSLVDLLMMAEQDVVKALDFVDIRNVWERYRENINPEQDAYKINGRIGSLPEKFDVQQILSSELANLWRSKVEEWKKSDLPQRVAQIMNEYYGFTIS